MRSVLSCAALAGALLVSAGAWAIPCPTSLPLLFIVQDESGSMGDAPDPSCYSCDSKWDSSTQAVTDLTTQFSNRFDFALEFFPADSTSCSAGTVVAGYPSTASEINDAYSNGAPGGSTPTAVSLDSARKYLQSLHLSVDAYVLLITDGEPNCNSALDPNTCQWSAQGCDPSSCYSTDCLDDVATATAAANLRNAGFPVYVVGFGSSVESNAAVLNEVAAAGGTATAYTATDEQSLSNALNSIAAQVANCCVSVCTNGTKSCDPTGNQMVCETDPTDPSCTAWTINACASGFLCSNGSCQPCQNACADGDYRCNPSSGAVEICAAGAGGCYNWAHYADCDLGYTCYQGSCVSCAPCTINETRCADSIDQQTCTPDWSTGLGCTQWDVAVQCSAGQQCTGDSCASCDACTPGATGCASDGVTVINCQRVNGCAAWQNGQVCPDFCNQGLCGVCGPACSGGCDGNKVIVCGVPDIHGCPTSSEQSCAAGQTCVNGACVACPASCKAGEQVCSGNNVMICQQQPSGCYALALKGACPAAQVCSQGQCTTPCSDACTQGDTKCNGGVPDNCVMAGNGCTAWQAGTQCNPPKVCAAGGCRDQCSGGEIETCSSGYICTTLSEGRLCMPAAQPDGGATNPDQGLDAGGGLIPDDSDSGTSTTPGKRVDAGAGIAPGGSGSCGCSATGAPLAMLAPLLLLPWRRRRS